MSATFFYNVDKEWILHGEGHSFDFLNDTGTKLNAGTPLVINDGTDDHFAILERDIEDGRVGTAHLCQKRRIWLAPYDGAANVAVGELCSMDDSSGDLIKGTLNRGVFIALPKQGATMTGADSAASTSDTVILVIEK